MSYIEPGEVREHLKNVVALDGGKVEPGPEGWIKPYVWRHPSEIPRREWLYGDHYLRGFLTATFAPGAVGKSALAIGEALAMATGRPLLGVQPNGRYRVGYFNGEDPLEETERRVGAAMLYFGVRPDEVEGFFFWGSGREAGLVVAEQTPDGTVINRPVVERVKADVARYGLDALVIDPFVSSHRVTENDNNAIDVVAKEWGRVAGEMRIGVEVVHHTTKAAIGREVRVEDGRGGGALLFAARSARVLNTMSEEEAATVGLMKARRYYFRVDNGKANLTPPPDRSAWFKFEGVDLGNGDNVGVVTSWDWPEDSAPRHAPAKLKFAGQKIVAAFDRLVEEGKLVEGQLAPGLSPGMPAVADADLRKMAYRIGLVTEAKPEDGSALTKWQAAARQAWKRGTEEVQTSKLLRFEAGVWWDIRRGGGETTRRSAD
ncbi:MAG: AAA family ATPase [Phenylobacterium sp.]|uniref:AAA family ATPase n=1 Tax=Phenylobacterium sp. TaxID=1871053 RepID=UPI001A5C7170|nr:AAA family ATPase [Phenylobacterium sp.]MBL8773896.1 AAA family ATPase [Phenylobacterium sp.]